MVINPTNNIDLNIATTGLSPTNILLAIAGSIVSSVIILLLDHLLKERLKRRKSNIWINFLKIDKYISECKEQYYEIESPKNIRVLISGLLGYFFGVFGYIFFIIVSVWVFQTFINIESWSLAYPTLIISLLAFIFSIIIRRNINKITDYTMLLNESERIALYIIFVNWFIFSSFLLILFVTFFMILTNVISIIEPSSIAAISIALLAIPTILSYANRRDLLDKARDLLNKQYFKQYVETFPKVRIKTKSMVLEGKVFDIFNDDMIILDYYGVKKAVEWDSITYMELKRYTRN